MGSYQCQEKCPGIEDVSDMIQEGAETSANDCPLSKQGYRQCGPSLLPAASDLRQVEAQFPHLENRFDDL